MGILRRSVHRGFLRDGWARVPLLDRELAASLRQVWLDEVRPYEGPLLRQLTSVPEVHRFSIDGHVVNPVVNPHRLDVFPRFAQLERTVMGAVPLLELVEAFLGGPAAMLQSAYYESSQGTLTHLDFNPIDRDAPMLGVWIALEDIGPEAGRFHLYPGSQRLPEDARLERFAELAWASYRQAFVDLDPAESEAEAQELLTGILADHALERVAPDLRAGEAVFWTNRILHGSAVPRPGGGTRHSLLLHFVARELVEAHGVATH